MESNNNLLGDITDRHFHDFILIVEKIIGMSVGEKIRSATLVQLGITSIQYISIIVELEAIFDIVFDVEKLVMSEFETLWEMYIYVENCCYS